MIPQNEIRRMPLYLLIILVFLIVAIAIGSQAYLKSKIHNIKKDRQDELSAIVDLKVSRIKNWWDNRLGDAAVIYSNKPLILRIREFLEERTNESIKIEILEWMKAVSKEYQYEDVILLDAGGAVALSVDPKDEKPGRIASSLASEAVRTRKTVVSDLYRCDVCKAINIDIFIPLITAPGDSGKVFGVIILRINPNQFLYPLVQYWPTSSRTAETLLVRREGDQVLFLNELRHKKNTALSLKLPLSEKLLPAAMAAKGKTGFFSGIDYRGSKVLAAIRKVPGTSWYLIAKVNESEIYAPIKHEILRVFALGFLLVIISSVFLALVWNRQISGFYRRQYEAEASRVKIEHELQSSEESFRLAFENAKDAIFWADPETGILLNCNKAAEKLIGRKKKDIIGEHQSTLHPKDREEHFKKLFKKEVAADGPAEDEGEAVNSRGDIIPVHISTSMTSVGGKKIIQGIFRDVTERKKLEDDLRKRIEDLERFQKVTIGRELKMRELKAKIEELEAKIAQRS